ncbi:MAG: DNA-3-methyladenine glycosylase [Deltaproteobacteria bacterium]|nr:DNA-3-methyladenine glycosylase [Deltaproteobacteria bacterium]
MRTNGPAKLVLALGIDGSLNGKPLGLPHLAVFEGKKVGPKKIVTTTRVGISVAKELPLRFYESGNPFVSVERRRRRRSCSKD